MPSRRRQSAPPCTGSTAAIDRMRPASPTSSKGSNAPPASVNSPGSPGRQRRIDRRVGETADQVAGEGVQLRCASGASVSRIAKCAPSVPPPSTPPSPDGDRHAVDRQPGKRARRERHVGRDHADRGKADHCGIALQQDRAAGGEQRDLVVRRAQPRAPARSRRRGRPGAGADPSARWHRGRELRCVRISAFSAVDLRQRVVQRLDLAAMRGVGVHARLLQAAAEAVEVIRRALAAASATRLQARLAVGPACGLDQRRLQRATPAAASAAVVPACRCRASIAGEKVGAQRRRCRPRHRRAARSASTDRLIAAA